MNCRECGTGMNEDEAVVCTSCLLEAKKRIIILERAAKALQHIADEIGPCPYQNEQTPCDCAECTARRWLKEYGG